MLIRVLGTVEVSASDSWVKAGSLKQNWVLAGLALLPNRSLSVDAIVNRFWEVDPPASARGVIYRRGSCCGRIPVSAWRESPAVGTGSTSPPSSSTPST